MVVDGLGLDRLDSELCLENTECPTGWSVIGIEGGMKSCALVGLGSGLFEPFCPFSLEMFPFIRLVLSGISSRNVRTFLDGLGSPNPTNSVSAVVHCVEGDAEAAKNGT